MEKTDIRDIVEIGGHYVPQINMHDVYYYYHHHHNHRTFMMCPLSMWHLMHA
jgi:hypothetical protein